MPSGGMNKKSFAVHKREGTLNTTKHGTEDDQGGIQFEPGTPEPPDTLSDRAKKEWFRVLPLLKEAGVLSPAYRATLACYCEMYAQFEESPRRFGMKSASALRQFANDLGLTPLAASRLGGLVKKPKAKSAFSDL